VAGRSTVVTGLRRAAEDYLAVRRALGFKLTTQATQLMSFVDYCESRGSSRITSHLAPPRSRGKPLPPCGFGLPTTIGDPMIPY
jgi:hypothetical protein